MATRERSIPLSTALLGLAALAGALSIALLPQAAGFDPTWGWWPLWSLAMPLSALLAHLLFRQTAARAAILAAAPRRRPRRRLRVTAATARGRRRRWMLAALSLPPS